MDKRALEYENQRNYLIGKKNQIEANYNSEEEYLEEQKTIQLETLAKQKEDILNLAKTLFGDNSWEDIQWVEELEQQLIKEKDEAYVYYIVGLVESQRIQAEEESINVQ